MEQGGGELIRVADNGCGIAADELPLAVASHATSKIRQADDLFSVRTLGFRGEALASIAEVSRLILRSRTADAESGAELEIVGGQSRPVVPIGCPVGTTIEVRNLFFNTPVRHKFLRTTQTEMGHTTEALTRLALAHPHVHFTLSHNGRLMHDLPPVDDVRERVAAFFGQEIADDLIEIESESDGVTLAGYVANPMHSRATGRMQYLFLNGRAIRDRSLQHALGEAYRGLLLTGRQPICFLRFDMPPELVDVNVHPDEAGSALPGRRPAVQSVAGHAADEVSDDRSDGPRQVARRTGRRRRTTMAATSGGGVSQLVHWAKEQLGQQPARELAGGAERRRQRLRRAAAAAPARRAAVSTV